MKKAFTLVELLIVIGILGVLLAVILPNFMGGRESARAAACLANMKNLGNACQSFGMSEGVYPRAGSCEKLTLDKNQAGSKDRSIKRYSEYVGWISWDSRGHYPGGKRQDSINNPTIGLYTTDQDAGMYALSNGVLWAYVSRNAQAYVCPSHVKARNIAGKSKPYWSYLVNSCFGGNDTKPCITPYKVGYQDLERADRRLLFSEVPYMGYSSWQPDGAAASTATDAVLQYGSGETIGANHVNGKALYAHVCFADGHTEKLRIPNTGSANKPKVDLNQLKNLTKWLCDGTDVTFNGSRYQEAQ